MRHVKAVVLAAALAAGCGSEWHLPFSNANPTLPSNISIGAPEGRRNAPEKLPSPPPSAPGVRPLGVPRNDRTRVWFVPASAGDMLRLAREPQLWEKARKRVDVFSFYVLQGYEQPDWDCGVPCGPNTLQALRDVVPGGMFRWLNEQGIQLSLEAVAVKDSVCTADKVRENADFTARVIGNIEATGALVSYVQLDEPFFSGTNTVDTPGFGGCAFSLEQTAALVKIYVDALQQQVPHVQVGLIEPYPAMSSDTIVSALLELERIGVRLPFFHIDTFTPSAVRDRADIPRDLRRIRELCAARGIPFGGIIFGYDGRTNAGFAEDAWATLRLTLSAVGVTEDTVFQSWAESEPGNLVSRKFVPDTVPETDPASHTGQVLAMLEYMRVHAAR